MVASLPHKHACFIHTLTRELQGLWRTDPCLAPQASPLPMDSPALLTLVSLELWHVLFYFEVVSCAPFPPLLFCVLLSNAYLSWKWLLLRKFFPDPPSTRPQLGEVIFLSGHFILLCTYLTLEIICLFIVFSLILRAGRAGVPSVSVIPISWAYNIL